MIKTFKINNFKCFPFLELNFNPLTILVGGNGVGKSTVIQSLLLYKYSLDIYLPLGERTDIVIKRNAPFEVPLNGPYLMQLGRAADVISSQPNSQEISFEAINTDGKSHKFLYDFKQDFGSHLLRGHVPEKYYKEKGADLPLNGPFLYLNAERLGPRKGLLMPPNSKIDVGYRGEYTGYAIHKADVDKRVVHNNLKLMESARFSHQIEAWLSIITPNQDFDYQVVEDMNAVSLKYRNSLLGTTFLSSTNTGFGISYVLPIIVAGLLLSTEQRSTLIVENPEAHLNPHGQSRIGRFLARLALSGVQVIIETHSEHVTNGARIEVALAKSVKSMVANFFTQKNSSVCVDELTINENGEFTKWPPGFFDQEKHDLKQLFMIKKRNL